MLIGSRGRVKTAPLKFMADTAGEWIISQSTFQQLQGPIFGLSGYDQEHNRGNSPLTWAPKARAVPKPRRPPSYQQEAL